MGLSSDDPAVSFPAVVLDSLPAGRWIRVALSLAQLGGNGASAGYIRIANYTDTTRTLWVDEWALSGDGGPPRAGIAGAPALKAPWINASWGAATDFSSTDRASSGTRSIRVAQGAGGGLSVHHGNWGAGADLGAADYDTLRFDIYGAADDLLVDVVLENEAGDPFPQVSAGAYPAGQWYRVKLAVSELNPGGQVFDRINIVETSGAARTYYVDQWILEGKGAVPGNRIFTDPLEAPWINTSWGGSVDFADTGRAWEGSTAVRADLDGWGGLRVHAGGWDYPQHPEISPYDSLGFAIWPDSAGPVLVGLSSEAGGHFPTVTLDSLPAGRWSHVQIPLEELAPGGDRPDQLRIVNYQAGARTLWVDHWGFSRPAGESSATVQLAYDDSGNLVSQSGKFSNITYEHRNLPVRFAMEGGDTLRAAYNADGQRILKETSSGAWQFYVMDGQQTIAVIDQSGLSHFNLVGNNTFGRLEANNGSIDTTNARRYYLSDHLGSTRAVVDEAGNVLETFDYYPFGLLMPGRSSTTGNTIEKFTGKERDDEGGLNLDYFGARYYDPALGRWHSVDPLADDYPSWSPYNYVENDPVNLIDRLGLCPEGYEEGDVWNGSVCGPEIVVTATREPAQASQANVSIPLGGLGFGRSIATSSRLGAAGMAAASLAYLNYLANQSLALQGTYIPSTHTGTIVLPNTGDRPWWESMKANVSIDGTDIVLPKDPTTSPGIDWEWRGRGKVGSKEGAWHNPKTGESLHPDLDHPEPIGPHWDYKDKTGKEWRVDPESGTKTPKN